MQSIKHLFLATIAIGSICSFNQSINVLASIETQPSMHIIESIVSVDGCTQSYVDLGDSETEIVEVCNE